MAFLQTLGVKTLDVISLFHEKKNKLKQHQEICGHKLKTHPCTDTYCRKAFRSAEQLRHHNKTDHPKSDKEALRYICEFCAKQLRSKQALRRHKAKHI